MLARYATLTAAEITDRAALDWLNEVSETGTRFLGLEIDLWKIGDSVPAPKFNVVARPKDWTRDGMDASALTDTQRMQLGFWEGFAEFVSRKGTVVKKTHAPRPHHWLGMLGVGRGGFFLHGVMSTWSEAGGHELRAELQITGQDTDHYFDLLHADRNDIEKEHEFGEELEWHNPTGVQQRRIYWRLATDFADPDRRTEQYRRLLERVEALHRILAPRVKATARVIDQVNSTTLNGFVDAQAGPDATVYTDGSSAYRGRENHEAVRHSVGEYVRGERFTPTGSRASGACSSGLTRARSTGSARSTSSGT